MHATLHVCVYTKKHAFSNCYLAAKPLLKHVPIRSTFFPGRSWVQARSKLNNPARIQFDFIVRFWTVSSAQLVSSILSCHHWEPLSARATPEAGRPTQWNWSRLVSHGSRFSKAASRWFAAILSVQPWLQFACSNGFPSIRRPHSWCQSRGPKPFALNDRESDTVCLQKQGTWRQGSVLHGTLGKPDFLECTSAPLTWGILPGLVLDRLLVLAEEQGLQSSHRVCGSNGGMHLRWHPQPSRSWGMD